MDKAANGINFAVAAGLINNSKIHCKYVDCVGISFAGFKHLNIKCVIKRTMGTTYLDDGHCEAAIYVIKRHYVT